MSDSLLIDQAIERFGAFYRVLHGSEESVEYGASYVDDRNLQAYARTYVGLNSFHVAVLDGYSALARSPKRRSGQPVDVFIDGVFARTAEWRGWPGDWEVDLDLPAGLRLEVTADFLEAQSELHLVQNSTTVDSVG